MNAQRNDPCPCGSGRKYKHCHGRPTDVQSGSEEAAWRRLRAGLDGFPTRITTSMLARLAEHGPEGELASAYEIPVEAVTRAVVFETALQAA